MLCFFSFKSDFLPGQVHLPPSQPGTIANALARIKTNQHKSSPMRIPASNQQPLQFGLRKGSPRWSLVLLQLFHLKSNIALNESLKHRRVEADANTLQMAIHTRNGKSFHTSCAEFEDIIRF